eukprot:Opistho-1_new@63250
MRAPVPLKSKRVLISLALFSTPFLILTISGSRTVSKLGIFFIYRLRAGEALGIGENSAMQEQAVNPPNGLPLLEQGVNLKPYNTFGLPAMASQLVRIREAADVRRVVDHPRLGRLPKFILGGGSNIVLTKDLEAPMYSALI